MRVPLWTPTPAAPSPTYDSSGQYAGSALDYASKTPKSRTAVSPRSHCHHCRCCGLEFHWYRLPVLSSAKLYNSSTRYFGKPCFDKQRVGCSPPPRSIADDSNKQPFFRDQPQATGTQPLRRFTYNSTAIFRRTTCMAPQVPGARVHPGSLRCPNSSGYSVLRPPPFFFGGHHDGYRVRSCCAGWRTLTPHEGNDRIT